MLNANPTSLTIMEINVGSLVSISRRVDLVSFTKDHHPDAVLIVETNLSEKHKVTIDNYNFIRNDKQPNRPFRGTGILLKDTTNHQPQDTSKWNLCSLEATATLIGTSAQLILLVSAYRHQKNSHALDTEDLEKIVAISHNCGATHLIIGGDFNALHEMWKNTNRNPSGIRLSQWLQSNALDLRLLTTKHPTFHRSNYSSRLDLFLVSPDTDVQFPPGPVDELEVLDYPSDHRAVKLRINIDSRLTKVIPKKFPNYNATDWRMFKDTLDSKLRDLNVPNHRNMSPTEIDDSIDQFTSAIRSTIAEIVPVVALHRRNQIPLPQNIIDLINNRKRLRRRWQRNRYTHYDYQLRSEISCLTVLIDMQIKVHHQQHWEKRLQSVTLDNSTFKKIKQFTGSLTREPTPALTIPNSDAIVSNDNDKADLLGSHFEAVHNRNHLIGDQARSTRINLEVNTSFVDHAPKTVFSPVASANPSFVYNPDRHLVSVKSLSDLLKVRPNKKSVGTDGIPDIVLKKMSLRAKIFTAMLFNQIYNSGYYPSAWKRAVVIPIHKKDKPKQDPNSYRPIALLPCISKLYESAVKPRLKSECSSLGVIPLDQFGFEFGRCTSQPQIKFQTDIATNLNSRKPTIACALDIEKAFDTIWHEGLVFKMKEANFSPHICLIIYNYLKGRSFVVKANSTMSKAFTITAGVPQGGVLSAPLFNIYVADLPQPAHHQNQIQRLQYADDTLLYVSTFNLFDGQERINRYLTELQSYYEKWKMKLNPGKAEAIVFRGTCKQHTKKVSRDCKNVKIVVDGHQLALQDKLKYLGVIYASRPTFVSHVDHAIRKASNAFNAIRPVLRCINGLSLKIKLLCYKQLVRPVLTYGFPAWCHISSHQMERLRVFERKCLRLATSLRRPIGSYRHISNKTLYDTANIDRIDIFLTNNAIRAFDKWPTSPLLDGCINLDGPLLRNNWRSPYKPAWYLHYLHQEDEIFSGNTPIYYHRRHNPTLDFLGTVYNPDT